MSALSPTAQRLERKLKRFARKVRTYHLLQGVAWTVALVIGLVVLTLVVDRWLKLSVAARIILGLGCLVGIFVACWRWILKPQLGSWKPLAVAAAVDRGLSQKGKPVTDLTQTFATLTSLRADEETGASPELVEEALKLREQHVDDCDLNEVVEYDQFARHYLALGLMILVPVVMGLMMPDTVSTWWNRWILGSDDKWPQQTWLVLEGMDGDHKIVPKGEPFELLVSARKGSSIPRLVEIDYEIDDRLDGHDVFRRQGENDFRYRMPGVHDVAEVTIFGGDDVLGPLTFEARARPRVASFTLKSHLPHTGERTESTFTNQDRELIFKSQTRIEVLCEANQPVEALILPEDLKRQIQVERQGDQAFRLSWSHVRRMAIPIELVSKETKLHSRPQILTIGLREDLAPTLTVAIDGLRERITPFARIPARVLGRDDNGLTGMELEILKGRSTRVDEAEQIFQDQLFKTEKPEEILASVEKSLEIDLMPMDLKPGRYLHVSAEGVDACHLGPQTGKSRRRLLSIVEPEQLHLEISNRLEKVRGRFRVATVSARESLDLLNAPPEQSELPQLLRRMRNLEREAWAARRTLGASARELELNRLIEEHAVQKLTNEVLDPLDVLHGQTLRVQRQAVEDAMKDLEAADYAEMAGRQERIIKEMERILRNLSEWDSFVDFINHLNEIIKRQEGLRRETQDASTGDGRD